MTNNSVKLLSSIKAINKEIAAVKTAGADLQSRIHILACSVLVHVGKHGDTRPVGSLVESLIDATPDMVRVNSLKQWFETFGQVKFVDGKAAFNKTAKTRLGEAMDKPFWKFKAMEGTPYQPIDMAKYVDQQVKKLEKDMKESGRDHKALILALRSHNVTVATQPMN